MILKLNLFEVRPFGLLERNATVDLIIEIQTNCSSERYAM